MAPATHLSRSGGWRGLWSALVHLLLFSLAYFLAFGVAWNFHFHRAPMHLFLPVMVPTVAIKLIVFWRMGLYRGWWRYTSLYDLLTMVSATLISSFILLCLVFAGEYLWASRQQRLLPNFPQLTFILDWGATIALVAFARVGVRLYHETVRPVPPGGPSNLLIIGTGDTAEAVVREIERMPEERYRVVGLLDDDPATWGSQIHGISVLGSTQQVREICRKQEVDEILIALPATTRRELRRVVELCEGTNARFRIVPDVKELIAGRVRVHDLPEVNITDLLGREEVTLDENAIADFLKAKRVLVTGAGGSIGSELCRQIIRYQPTELVLVEQAENNLFEIERELSRRTPNLRLIACVADICDAARISRIFGEHRPEVVFHAAAHKHVPMMERNPGEAIKNNILGTRTVADAVAASSAGKFVFISTDKAVRPTGIMGCTKRVAEMYIQQLSSHCQTQFVTVRFGNVLGSSGSVVPIFQEQIAAGGPLTVTHPDVTRYFMTIPEACQLVMQAGAMGRGGEIFVLDMGEPVKIVDLAKELITLSGFTPGEQIEITFTGLRPGEKLFEELSIEGEGVGRTTHPKIGIWQNRPESMEAVCHGMEDLLAMADEDDLDRIRQRLKQLVPEYQPPDQASSTEAPPKAKPSADDSAARSA
ncbi:MAG TPA: nucleoside-diphosphate sugar epimerase/dehydratase [Phycisphaerae bacterium]|nr:nucleoside-diphosphate sugar epimerase/dehydratase [Phycisphaerae bacterium]